MDPVSSRADPLLGDRGTWIAITSIGDGISFFGVPITLFGGVIAQFCGIEHVDEPAIALVGSRIPLVGLGVTSVSHPVSLIGLTGAAPARRVGRIGGRCCRRRRTATAPGDAAQQPPGLLQKITNLRQPR
jgi:hypothetical protein